MKMFVLLYPLASLALAFALTSNAADPKLHSFDLIGARTVPFQVRFTSNLQACAVVGTNGSVQIRDLQAGTLLAEVTPPPAQLDGQPAPVVFDFLPGSGHLVVGCGVHLAEHDPGTGGKVRSLEPTTDPVTSLQISPDGRWAVARLGQLPTKSLAFWNLTNGQALQHLPTDKPPGGYNIRMTPVRGLAAIPRPQWIEPYGIHAFAPTGNRFFTALERADVDVWDLDQARCLGTWFPGPYRGTVTAAVALDDHRVAVVVGHHELGVIDPIANTKALWIAGHPIPGPTTLEIRALALSGDGRRLAVAGMRMKSRPGVMAPAGDVVYDVPLHGEVQIWEVATGKVLTTLRGRPTEKFVQVALDHTGGRIAAVHNGVSIQPNWTGAMQQAGSFKPTEPLRVTVWELLPPN